MNTLTNLETIFLMADKNNKSERILRHLQRMQRKKQVIDARVAKANIEHGVVILLKGTGKGKSSSAFGMVVRALGHGMRVGVIQFIKGKQATGERLFLQDHSAIDYHVMGTGFTWETQDQQTDISAAKTAWAYGEKMLRDETLSLVVFDEITYMFKYGYLPTEEVIAAINTRPEMQNVIITGRTAPEDIEALADTVSEVKNIKHAFSAGIKAQKGIEW